MKKDPVARNDLALLAQCEMIATNLPAYATALGLPATDLTGHAADTLYMRFAHTQYDRYGKVAQNWTSWKNLVRDGGDGGSSSAPAHPAAPASVPPAVAPGIVPRLRALIRRIKASGAYSVAIGKALGIEGAEEAAPELDTLQPELETAVAGDKVRIGWTRGAADALEIHVDRGEGKGFVFLAVDSVPDYFDTTPFPAASAVWKYKAMYRKDDERIGQWSAVVSVGLGT